MFSWLPPGIVKLGNAFQGEGAVVGIYDVVGKTLVHEADRLSRPGKSRAVGTFGQGAVPCPLRRIAALSSGKKVAVLDLDVESLQIVGDCPVTGQNGRQGQDRGHSLRSAGQITNTLSTPSIRHQIAAGTWEALN